MVENVSPMWWRAERESMMDDLERRFEKMMVRAMTECNEKANEAKEIAELAGKQAQEAKVAVSEMKEAMNVMRAEMRSEIEQVTDQLPQREPRRVQQQREPAKHENVDPATDKRNRTVIFGPFPQDTKSTAIKQFIDGVMNAQTDIEETFAYGKKFAERGAARFKTSDAMWDFMRTHAGSHTYDFHGTRIYCNPDSAAKDPDSEDAMRERAIRKLVRAIIETVGGDGQMVKKDIDANYRKGVVWWKEARVAEWSNTSRKLSFVGSHADFECTFNKLLSQE